MPHQWVDHSAHRHRLYFDGDTMDTFKCSLCGETGAKQQYKCTDRDSGCKFRVHTVCAEVVSEIKPAVYDGRYKFEFRPKSKKNDPCYCVACGKGIKGVSYYYGPEKLHLHLYCNREFKPKITVNSVSLKLTKEISSCQHCERREYKGVKFKTWAYVSDCGRYRYFAACILDARVTRYKEALKNRSKSSSDSHVTHRVSLNRRSASIISGSQVSDTAAVNKQSGSTSNDSQVILTSTLNKKKGPTGSGSHVNHNMHHGIKHQMFDVIVDAVDFFNVLIRAATSFPF